VKPFDLITGAARLDNALQVLQAVRLDVMEHWTDQNAQSFDETYLEPLESKVKQLLVVVNHLSEVLSSAHRDCEPR
jgi:hypothetical protein